MKNLILALAFIIGLGITFSCSSGEDDVILGYPYPNPIRVADLNQTVRENDNVTVKSIVPSRIFCIKTKYNQTDKISDVYLNEARHHWLEVQQTNDSTYIFHVQVKEASDTVTYLEVHINGLGPYGIDTITFHLVP
jgi:hypothetical protein